MKFEILKIFWIWKCSEILKFWKYFETENEDLKTFWKFVNILFWNYFETKNILKLKMF